MGVARIAKKRNVPVIALARSLGNGYQAVYEHGIDAVYSIVPGPMSLETALARAQEYTEELAENVARTIKRFRV
jgi:hypothetical protein